MASTLYRTPSPSKSCGLAAWVRAVTRPECARIPLNLLLNTGSTDFFGESNDDKVGTSNDREVKPERIAHARKSHLQKSKEDLREGRPPSTAAGEFVREEIEHVREGKHGARSPQQAIAIGLSKAGRAGVPLKPPRRGRASAGTRKRAARDYQRGRSSAGRRAVAPPFTRPRARVETRAAQQRIPFGVAAASPQRSATP